MWQRKCSVFNIWRCETESEVPFNMWNREWSVLQHVKRTVKCPSTCERDSEVSFNMWNRQWSVLWHVKQTVKCSQHAIQSVKIVILSKSFYEISTVTLLLFLCCNKWRVIADSVRFGGYPKQDYMSETTVRRFCSFLSLTPLLSLPSPSNRRLLRLISKRLTTVFDVMKIWFTLFTGPSVN